MAHRTLNQPQIFVNNLAIRRASEELKVARDYDQVCRILLAAFGTMISTALNSNFSCFRARSFPLDSIDLPASRRKPNTFRWQKPSFVPCSRCFLCLDYCTRSAEFCQQSAWGFDHACVCIRAVISSSMSISLTGAFPTALADAIDRTLVRTAEVIALPEQDPSLITAQAG